jgi:sodium/potassium-transporting ATPase subunit alpha
VVPIPLPLSAILILVIGTCILTSTQYNHPLIDDTLDLGFELCVAVSAFMQPKVCLFKFTHTASQLSFAWDQPETTDGLMRLKPRKPGKQMRPVH